MIENTSNRDPLLNLIGLTDGLRHDDSDAYITGMEAAGQRQLVNSEQMPIEGPWDQLEALGFTKGDPVPGDASFHIVRPGYKLAFNAVWGDEPPALPTQWNVLTDAEKAEYVAVLQRELDDNLSHEKYCSGTSLVEHRAQANRIRAFQALVPAMEA